MVTSKDSSVCQGGSNVLPPSRVSVVPEGGRKDTSVAAESTVAGGVVQAVTCGVAPDSSYAPYLYTGTVKFDGVQHTVRILRDTGSSISLLVRPKVPSFDVGGEYVLIRGVTGAKSVPLISCEVKCKLFEGNARLGVVDYLRRME